MRIKVLFLIVAIWFSGIGFARADIINPLKLKQVWQDTEIKVEVMGSNTWINGAANRPSSDTYTGVADYRVETSIPVYKLAEHEGKVVTRTQGIGYFDENIQDFFADRLIDLPELFMVDSSSYGDDIVLDIVFGKFAHRRFIDKNEVVRDPFDIGKRAYFGQSTGTNNLLALINQNREGSGRFVSKVATGSYGFALVLKDTSGTGLWNRWALKQTFAVIEMDDFGDNYYQATNITKNWGSEINPGQFDLGYVYAQNRVLLRSDLADDTHILFGTLAQRFDRLALYSRYGVAFAGLFEGDNTHINNVQLGASYDLTEKDTIGLEYVSLNSNKVNFFDSNNLITSYWTHSFNENLNLNTYIGFGEDALDPTTPGGRDNNWMIGFNVQGLL